MSTLFPGSGSTRSTPPKLVGGGGGTPYTGVKWETKYECDFSAVTGSDPTDCDWLGAGNQTYPSLNGVGWGALGGGGVNGNNTLSILQNFASDLNYTAGTGIQITTQTTTSDYNGDDQRAPRVVALMSDIIPSLSYEDTVCFQVTGNCTEDPLNLGSGSWYDIAGFGLSVGRWTGYAYGGPYGTSLALSMTSAQQLLGPMGTMRCGGSSKYVYPSPAANYTLFEVIVYPNLSLARCSAGFWTGSFPEPGTMAEVANGYPAVSGVGPSQPGKGPDPAQIPSQLILDLANTYVGLFLYGSGTAGYKTANFTKFRALRLE